MKKSLFTYCLFISVLISFPLLASSVDYNLQILNVNTENFPDAVFVEFTVTDAEGNFIPNLTQNDFTIKDNAIKKFGCKRLVQDLTEQQLPIDIVFIVDNSVSMSDEQDKISEALPLLLEGLSKKGDVRVGLIRFGDSDYNPSASQWGVVEKNNMGFFFSSLSDSADIRSFVETIWKQNRYDGVYEPYYNVLDWSARQDFGYRNNAVRIFIMLGDEPYCNNHNNSKTPLSEDEVCSVLSEYGIQTFIIQSEYNKFKKKGGKTDSLPLEIHYTAQVSYSDEMSLCLVNEITESVAMYKDSTEVNLPVKTVECNTFDAETGVYASKDNLIGKDYITIEKILYRIYSGYSFEALLDSTASDVSVPDDVYKLGEKIYNSASTFCKDGYMFCYIGSDGLREDIVIPFDAVEKLKAVQQ